MSVKKTVTSYGITFFMYSKSIIVAGQSIHYGREVIEEDIEALVELVRLGRNSK